MKILVLDNYDSFTFNLVHLIEKVSDYTVDVFANDQLALSNIEVYDKILLSPGPGLPSQAGIMPELITHYAATKSLFGVCLGLQAIGEAFGSSLLNLNTVFHGIATPIHVIKNDPLFQDMPTTFQAGRYHSWVIDEKTISPQLEVTARDEKGFIMAIRHKQFDISAVQFHPESILSEHGEQIMRNWLKM